MYTGHMTYTFLWLVLHLRQQKRQELQKNRRPIGLSARFLSVLRPWVKEDQSRVHFYVALNYRFGSPAYFWWGGGRNNPSTERWGKEARQRKGVILSPVPVGMIKMLGWYMIGCLDIYCIREIYGTNVALRTLSCFHRRWNNLHETCSPEFWAFEGWGQIGSCFEMIFF